MAGRSLLLCLLWVSCTVAVHEFFVCPQVNQEVAQHGKGEICGGACRQHGTCKEGLHCKLEDSQLIKHFMLGVSRSVRTRVHLSAPRQGVCVEQTQADLMAQSAETRSTQAAQAGLWGDP
eukprot:TRINITY_DN3596_c0_g1_i2.p2 TRINITY_DN3596_c0_g1~~TRINITY_DN3596_c0_g1_i2.p2  ORF type:complete len:120 (+),score=22.86 TRINITY_DN3596_c0_g1_i2:173-532(+)